MSREGIGMGWRHRRLRRGAGIREFICVLPAGWASRRSEKAGKRSNSGDLSPPNLEQNRRATTTLLSVLSPFRPSLHLAPGFGATIRKGVNRNGIIYMRARGSDSPSNRWCVKSFSDLAEELIYSFPSTISILIPYDWNFCGKDLIVLSLLFCTDVRQMLNSFRDRKRGGKVADTSDSSNFILSIFLYIEVISFDAVL